MKPHICHAEVLLRSIAYLCIHRPIETPVSNWSFVESFFQQIQLPYLMCQVRIQMQSKGNFTKEIMSHSTWTVVADTDYFDCLFHSGRYFCTLMG